jgi:phosphoglycolate phosphatase
MKWEAVIFDYDGTLVHLNIDFEALRRDVKRSLIGYGVDPDTLKDRYILEMINEGAALISGVNLSEAKTFYDEAHKLVQDHEIRAAENGEMLPGATNTLMQLTVRGIKVGIITRNCKKAVQLGFPQIERYCDVFIPRDDIIRVKPHPDHLATALEKLGVMNPNDCLMVGDHILDIKAGIDMDMKTAGVLTGKTTHLQFMEAGADLILDDATKVLDFIDPSQLSLGDAFKEEPTAF